MQVVSLSAWYFSKAGAEAASAARSASAMAIMDASPGGPVGVAEGDGWRQPVSKRACAPFRFSVLVVRSIHHATLALHPGGRRRRRFSHRLARGPGDEGLP